MREPDFVFTDFLGTNEKEFMSPDGSMVIKTWTDKNTLMIDIVDSSGKVMAQFGGDYNALLSWDIEWKDNTTFILRYEDKEHVWELQQNATWKQKE